MGPWEAQKILWGRQIRQIVEQFDNVEYRHIEYRVSISTNSTLCNVIQLWFFQFLTKIITFSVLPNFCTGIVATLWLYTKKYFRYNLSIYWWKNIIEYSIYCFHVRLILLNNYSAFRERLDLEWDTKVKLIKLMEVKQPILCLQSFS